METMRLPIYPSTEVLFPGQLLPLHAVGKQRVLVLRLCEMQKRPVGVVWLSDEEGRALARVGTLANLIVRNEEDAETPVAWVIGHARFQIAQLHHDEAHVEATVRLWPWAEQPAPQWQVIEGVGMYLRRYINAFSDWLPPTLLPQTLPPRAATLGVLGATLLNLSSAEKQQLLETPSAQGLLAQVLVQMRRYVPMAERLAAMYPAISEEHENVSMN